MTYYYNDSYRDRNRHSFYLFGSHGLFDSKKAATQPQQLNSESGNRIAIRGNQLIIEPFCVSKYNLRYINPVELSIDIDFIEPGIYTIIVVHNFNVEDNNPNLSECLAGIYLARQNTDSREQPENFPLECRAIKVLGTIDTHRNCFYDHEYD